MKRIPDAELARAAMSKGATISHEGRTINASADKLVLPPARPVAPIPQDAPPPPLAANTTALERAAEAGSHNTERLTQVVATLVAELRAQRAGTVQGPPVAGWHFTIERDSRGQLSGIRVTKQHDNT